MDIPDRQMYLAFLKALKARARNHGPLPEYVPEQWREYLLRIKSRHEFRRSAG